MKKNKINTKLKDELEIKENIINELIQAIVILGAKSDLLCITGSYKDTHSDKEIIFQLQEWNRLNL